MHNDREIVSCKCKMISMWPQKAARNTSAIAESVQNLNRNRHFRKDEGTHIDEVRTMFGILVRKTVDKVALQQWLSSIAVLVAFACRLARRHIAGPDPWTVSVERPLLGHAIPVTLRQSSRSSCRLPIAADIDHWLRAASV